MKDVVTSAQRGSRNTNAKNISKIYRIIRLGLGIINPSPSVKTGTDMV